MDVIINGTRYQVGVASIARSYRTEEKYRVTTEDGRVHREVRAVYADFTLSLGNLDGAEYDRLMRAVAAARGDVSVSLPAAEAVTREYIGVFDDIKDAVLYEAEDGTVHYDNLELAFVGTVPLEEGAL